MEQSGKLQVSRPDILDLIGADYDQPFGSAAADRTLIVCAAPRTGSFELCRLLVAAGVGVPHEYFNPNYAKRIASRFEFEGEPLATDCLGRYIDLLRRRRSANGVFAVKMQYWQFDRFLRNTHGGVLFDEAHVVHLFRSDVARQFASWRAARFMGRWDFSARQTTLPVKPGPPEEWVAQALSEIEYLLSEDSGFRRLFILLGIQPLFFTLEDICRSPQAMVDRIAGALGVRVDAVRLAAMIRNSAPYSHELRGSRTVLREAAGAIPSAYPDAREQVASNLINAFKQEAFRNCK
jgi:LPS sulfotransferase NodH